eukprot:TRINITY_DN76693_c0_g1_i1.p1 TRINITY_DN76693_c0_g1~~TRINITY_DN76693_c0_g1_i1.p1  ORF type:complete len:421 (+),score=45.97 TRINITY_DN76693_c0_g1_i1:176-1438(+)
MLYVTFALCAMAVLPGGCATCPLTKQEQEIAEYIARREHRYSDGTIQQQISDGSYTADSLSIDMYRWWVQLGLGNQRDAIDQFQTTIEAAGKEIKQPAHSIDWVGVALGLMDLIAKVCVPEASKVISSAISAISKGIDTWKKFAVSAAAPSAQGGSKDFLKAAMKWRDTLPTVTTNQLLMVDTFINEIKSIGKSALLPGYKFVTDLIKSTMSYRYVLNSYYIAFLKSSIPKPTNAFFVTSFDSMSSQSLSFQKLLWSSTQQGQDGCTIVEELMNINENCIGPKTPGFQNSSWKVLLAYGEHGSPSLWYGLQYDCNNLAPNAYEGCWNGATDEKGGNEWLPRTSRLCMQFGQIMFNSMKAYLKSPFVVGACNQGISKVDAIAAGNWVDENQFPIQQFDSVSDVSSYTCKPSIANLSSSFVV